MNGKTKRPATIKPQSTTCLCRGAGPLLSETLRRLGPPETARRHFDAAGLEFLKGLRAVLDGCIAQMSRSGSKGEKIKVE